MKLEQIYPGIADTAELLRLVNRSHPSSPYHAIGVRPGQWFECSEADFWYFLGSSPPVAHTGHAFACEEFITGNLTDSFHRIGGRFFCMTIAYTGRKSVLDATAALTNLAASSKAG